jgi:hypothetical protein
MKTYEAGEPYEDGAVYIINITENDKPFASVRNLSLKRARKHANFIVEACNLKAGLEKLEKN